MGPGDEVTTVANTAAPTVSAVEQTGARPGELVRSVELNLGRP